MLTRKMDKRKGVIPIYTPQNFVCMGGGGILKLYKYIMILSPHKVGSFGIVIELLKQDPKIKNC